MPGSPGPDGRVDVDWLDGAGQDGVDGDVGQLDELRLAPAAAGDEDFVSVDAVEADGHSSGEQVYGLLAEEVAEAFEDCFDGSSEFFFVEELVLEAKLVLRSQRQEAAELLLRSCSFEASDPAEVAVVDHDVVVAAFDRLEAAAAEVLEASCWGRRVALMACGERVDEVEESRGRFGG